VLSRWVNLDTSKRKQLNELFVMNRKLLKAYQLKESLDRLWMYRYEGVMLRYLEQWIGQLRWQRLKPFQKLARLLRQHLEGILSDCGTKVPLGVVEAVDGNLKTLLHHRTGLSQSALSAAQGATYGRHQNRIRGLPESRVKWALCQILNESPKIRARRQCPSSGSPHP
jgi:hypothetical protein